MNNSARVGLFLSLLVLISVGGYLLYGKYAVKPVIKVKIGFMAPLSGENISYGLGIERGMQLAKRQMGLDQVELISRDTLCEPAAAEKGVRELIDNEKVVAIIGEVCSSATLAAAPYAASKRVPMISPSSTSPKLTGFSPFLFRTVLSDDYQGVFGAKFVYGQGVKKLAILYSDEDYGRGFAAVLDKSFKSLGGEVVASETFKIGSVNLKSQLKKIKESGATGIYLISNSLTSSAACMLQAKELGLTAAFYGSEALKDQSFLSNVGKVSEGLLITSIPDGNKSFVSSYRGVYSVEPIQFTAQAYDAFYAIGLALKNGARTGDEIATELRKVSFKGTTGDIKFNKDGDLTSGDYDVYKVVGGKFVKQ